MPRDFVTDAALGPQSTFTDYADFAPAFNAARQAAIRELGERWYLHSEAFVWARLPVAWTRVKVAGRTTPRQLEPLPGVHWSTLRKRLPDEVVGERWSRAPRDQKLPVGRFWRGGELPVGPEYAIPGPAKLKPRTSFPSLSVLAKREQQHVYLQSPAQVQMMFPEALPEPDPPKPRRPSGIGLASGYARADEDYYVEPRWLVDALLRHETFDSPVVDPCCGGGQIVSALRDAGYTASGSDLYDRGFGERADVLQLRQPLASVVCNPPFKLAEAIVWQVLPLLKTGGKLAMLLRLAFLESEERRALFSQTPLARVWVSRRRASMPPGRIDGPRDHHGALIPAPASGGSTPYAWLVWEPDRIRPTTLGWL